MDKITLPVFSDLQMAEHIYRDYKGATIEIAPEVETHILMETIQWGIDHLVTDSPLISTPLLRIMKDFCILEAFTNLKMKDIDMLQSAEGIYRVYDLVKDLADDVRSLVSSSQCNFLCDGLEGLSNEILKYRNSAAGILTALTDTANKSTTAFNENLAVLQDVEGLENIKGLLSAIRELDTPIVP